MFESHFQISEARRGALDLSFQAPQHAQEGGNIKRNGIKHPSYFYYSSIYNVTSYCFSTVCLWCRWIRDTRRKSSVSSTMIDSSKLYFIFFVNAKECLLNFTKSQEFMRAADLFVRVSLPVGQAIEHVKTETLSWCCCRSLEILHISCFLVYRLFFNLTWKFT